MATRAIVRVEGLDYVELYKHYDGYPKGMLSWLTKFNTEFTQKRGDDPSYKFAQLIRSSVSMAEEFNLDSSSSTGYGVQPYGSDLGQEFTYTLLSDGNVSYVQEGY